ncbi:MAG TPA: hypothetical protein VKA94_07770, partial [Hyphomicrobiales bacterium]|nr:hypothetical protein [Hyphomicrobiales bacterium]
MNLPLLNRRFAESLSLYNLLVKSGLHELPPECRADQPFPGERSILRNAGLPDDASDRLDVLARRWGVSLREVALTIGAVSADDYVKSAARLHGVEVMAGERTAELEPI